MSDDLVKRLHEEGLGWGVGTSILCAAAASEITRLRAELAKHEAQVADLTGRLGDDISTLRAELAAARKDRDEACGMWLEGKAERDALRAEIEDYKKAARELYEDCDQVP